MTAPTPPAPLPPGLERTPRHLQARPEANATAMTVMRLAAAILAMASLALIVCILAYLALALLGVNQEAQIGRKHTINDGSEAPVMEIEFLYNAGGKWRRSSCVMSSPAYAQYAFRRASLYEEGEVPPGTPDDTLNVRVVSLGPWAMASPLMRDVSIWRAILPLMIAMIVGAVLAALGAQLLGGRDLRLRRLLQRGVPVPGRITARDEARDGLPGRWVAYEYVADGRRLERKQRVWGIDCDQARVGQAVTVLHWPGRPGRAVAYELTPYRYV